MHKLKISFIFVHEYQQFILSLNKNNMKKILLLSIFVASLFTSCTSDDDNQSENLPAQVQAPEDYTFTRNNESTVKFTGQTTRIFMAEEIITAFKSVDDQTQESLQAMFAHQEGAEDFSDPELNASSKSVRSKTAASSDYFSANATEATEIKAMFDNYISIQTTQVFPNWSIVAAPGVAGQIADGSSTRYIAANGLEYNQAFAKGLIGAFVTDQILNNYLSPSVLDGGDNVSNNDSDITDGDNNYTTMEHKWDEAYGYLFGGVPEDSQSNPLPTIGDNDSFLNKYVGKTNSDPDFNTIAQDIFDAFKLGRAAIVAKNYQVRDEQAAILQQKISQVIAIRAIYYLQTGKSSIESEDFGAAFHDLSEGYGFLTSLRFTRDTQTGTSIFTKSDVASFISDLMNDGPNGLWDVTPATLDAISEQIASRFSFTVAQAASSN